MPHAEKDPELPQGLRQSQDPADRVSYSRDLWPRHHLAVRAGNVAAHRPRAIVWPESTEEVSELLAWATQTHTAVVPFGAGSGVCAGVLPSPRSVVVDLKRMKRIRHLDVKGCVLEVEAGAMGLPLEEHLQSRGVTLGHFPSSILCSTVGGWVAGRSAGQCSGRYGKIEDMVLSLECVTGTGKIVRLHQRTTGPSLVPLVVGSEGTLAVVTSATLRLFPKPEAQAFAGYSFPTTESGWEGMRVLFQAGLRPAVSRLYDPFDAMLARRGSVKKKGGGGAKGPGFGTRALRQLLKRPALFNEALESGLGSRALGGALLVLIFEGTPEQARADAARARELLEPLGAEDEGEGPARKWLRHRYSVSYRQAPVFAGGMFSDTMEVAAPWSRLGELYRGVREALGRHVFVMAHLSHAYPDGCCIYFSFAGTASASEGSWDSRSAETYDQAWASAQDAVLRAGGTIAHHHGVGRSKAPRVGKEVGPGGLVALRALMKAFDPAGILNPGNLLPETESPYRPAFDATRVLA